jgi:hypothetical protein
MIRPRLFERPIPIRLDHVEYHFRRAHAHAQMLQLHSATFVRVCEARTVFDNGRQTVLHGVERIGHGFRGVAVQARTRSPAPIRASRARRPRGGGRGWRERGRGVFGARLRLRGT